MTETDSRRPARAEHDLLSEQVGRRAERKLRAERSTPHTVWFGLGMFGLIGWSVAIPTLIGIAVGVWLDHRYPATVSWTLTLLIVGAALGCFNAWYWMSQESRHE